MFKECQFDCFSLASRSLVSNTLLSKAKSIQKYIFELVIDGSINSIQRNGQIVSNDPTPSRHTFINSQTKFLRMTLMNKFGKENVTSNKKGNIDPTSIASSSSCQPQNTS